MTNLKVYISCGLNQYEKYEEIKEEIELFDINITFDWTKFFKNQEAPMELSRKHSKEALKALNECELFILFLNSDTHPNQYFEFGYFYNLALNDNNKMIILFSPSDPFQQFFYSSLPNIKYVRSLRDMKYMIMEWLEKKGYKIKDINWDEELYEDFLDKERF